MWQILTVVLAVSTVFFIIISYRKVLLQEEYEKIIKRYDERQTQTRQKLIDLVETMRVIDLNGSFESDDEVGITFKQLQELISEYNTIIDDEERSEE